MFIGQRSTDIEIRASESRRCTVPNNDTARLMYFLGCVSHCLPGYRIDRRLVDYDNYARLTSDERIVVATLAALFSPALLLGRVFFEVEQNNSRLNGLSNTFHELRELNRITGLALGGGGSLLVNGAELDVHKIVICTHVWLKTYYLDPICQEGERIVGSSRSGVPAHAHYLSLNPCRSFRCDVCGDNESYSRAWCCNCVAGNYDECQTCFTARFRKGLSKTKHAHKLTWTRHPRGRSCDICREGTIYECFSCAGCDYDECHGCYQKSGSN